MRIRILGLILLLTLNNATATDIHFDLSKFNANPPANRQVTLQPMSPFPGDLLWFTSDTNGMFTFTNAGVGDYAGTIKAPPRMIQFQISVKDTDTNLGTIEAASITTIGGVQTYPSTGKTAWTMQASDQRYQMAGTTASSVSPTNFAAQLAAAAPTLSVGSAATAIAIPSVFFPTNNVITNGSINTNVYLLNTAGGTNLFGASVPLIFGWSGAAYTNGAGIGIYLSQLWIVATNSSYPTTNSPLARVNGAPPALTNWLTTSWKNSAGGTVSSVNPSWAINYTVVTNYFYQYTNLNQGAVCFVTTTGNDNTGKRGNVDCPFASYSAAISNMVSGDTLIFGPGTFMVGNGTWGGVVANGILPPNCLIKGQGKNTLIYGTWMTTNNTSYESFCGSNLYWFGKGTENITNLFLKNISVVNTSDIFAYVNGFYYCTIEDSDFVNDNDMFLNFYGCTFKNVVATLTTTNNSAANTNGTVLYGDGNTLINCRFSNLTGAQLLEQTTTNFGNTLTCINTRLDTSNSVPLFISALGVPQINLVGNPIINGYSLFKTNVIPQYASIGLTNYVFQWVSNGVSPHVVFSLFDAQTNLQTISVGP